MSEELKPTEGSSRTESSHNASAGRQRRQRTEYRSDGAAARKGLRYIVLPIVGVTVLGLVVWMSARPVWRKIREYRGHSFAVQALQEFKDGRVADSMKSLRSAVAMAPNDNATLENAASILATEDVPDALDFWQKLFQKGAGSLEDRLRYTALASRLGRFGLAITELNKLLAVDPKNLDAKQMLVDVSMRAGDFKTAIAHARELVSVKSTPDRECLLGLALVQSSKTAKTAEELKLVQEGATMLFSIATNTGPYQSHAAAALADHTQLVGEAARAVVAALEKKTPLSGIDLLAMTVIQVRSEPEKAPLFMSRMADKMAPSALDDRLRAADWLAAHQGLEPAARLIRPEDSRTNYLASLLELDIASRRQQWGFIKQALANTNRVISPTVRSCLEAGVAMSEGGAQKADALYRTAMDAAAVTVTADSDLQYIAIMAERTTNLLAAVSAHEFRLQRGANVGDASANILRLTANGLPLVRQFPALEARHNLMPEDVATSSQYFYTAALLGRNLEDAKRGLTALREAYPDRPEPILGLAVIAIRTGALVEATNMLEEHPLDFETIPARLRAALVHVLGRIGQKDLARAYARKLDLTAYYPEERELVEPWLNR